MGWNKLHKRRQQRRNRSFSRQSCSAIDSIILVAQDLVFSFYLLLDFFFLKCIKRSTEFNSVNTFKLYQTCNLILKNQISLLPFIKLFPFVVAEIKGEKGQQKDPASFISKTAMFNACLRVYAKFMT